MILEKELWNEETEFPCNIFLGRLNLLELILCDHRALVPRSETEQLVEHIIKRVDSGFDGTIVDLGTGTGAIVFLCASIFALLGNWY